MSSPIAYDEFLDKILVASFRVGKATCSSAEISQKDNSLKDTEAIDQAASFMSYLGIMTEEQSLFGLSLKGREIAIALAEEKKDIAKKLWQEVLRTHVLYSQLQEYIKNQEINRATSDGSIEYVYRGTASNTASNWMVYGAGKRICVLYASKDLLKFDQAKDTISIPTITAESSGKDVPP